MCMYECLTWGCSLGTRSISPPTGLIQVPPSSMGTVTTLTLLPTNSPPYTPTNGWSPPLVCQESSQEYPVQEPDLVTSKPKVYGETSLILVMHYLSVMIINMEWNCHFVYCTNWLQKTWEIVLLWWYLLNSRISKRSGPNFIQSYIPPSSGSCTDKRFFNCSAVTSYGNVRVVSPTVTLKLPDTGNEAASTYQNIHVQQQ